jgi:hypothetical protein
MYETGLLALFLEYMFWETPEICDYWKHTLEIIYLRHFVGLYVYVSGV